jgi:hypothetical protein
MEPFGFGVLALIIIAIVCIDGLIAWLSDYFEKEKDDGQDS